jgi:PII-like signaling protein
MEMLCVRFYVEEGMRHEHLPIGDWLFEQAREVGISGGTAFRAAAGFGRHGLHEDHFFELAGKLPEAVEFFAAPAAIEALILRVGASGLRLLYITYPVKAGMTGS